MHDHHQHQPNHVDWATYATMRHIQHSVDAMLTPAQRAQRDRAVNQERFSLWLVGTIISGLWEILTMWNGIEQFGPSALVDPYLLFWWIFPVLSGLITLGLAEELR